MTIRSDPALLSLHGVRVLGCASAAAIAERFRLDPHDVHEHLLDAQAYGWANRHRSAGDTWSLTESGRVENERQLATELEASGGRQAVAATHRRFVALNRRHAVACTNWQLRPTGWNRRQLNDHSDPDWDTAVLVELEAVDAELRALNTVLSGVLARFDGYQRRHAAALKRVQLGQAEWLDAPDRASVQLIWIQLHEDLLATLGIPRGSDG